MSDDPKNPQDELPDGSPSSAERTPPPGPSDVSGLSAETPETHPDSGVFVPPSPPRSAGEIDLDGSAGPPAMAGGGLGAADPEDFADDGGRDWESPVPSEARRADRPWLVPVVVGLLLLLLLVGWLWMRSGSGGPPELPPGPEQPVSSPPPVEEERPTPEPEPVEPLPALSESDPWVREALSGALEHPRLAAWLAPEGLVQRFVAAVDDIARGKSPRAHLVSVDPGRGFRVDEAADGSATISPRSFRRYDGLVDAFVALDTPEALRLYREMEPLFEEAYRDLGYPDAEFRAVLETAIGRLLEVEVPDEAPSVRPRITSWAFADPALEALSPAEKHLVRLGPRNARKVQSKLRALQTALTLAPTAST